MLIIYKRDQKRERENKRVQRDQEPKWEQDQKGTIPGIFQEKPRRRRAAPAPQVLTTPTNKVSFIIILRKMMRTERMLVVKLLGMI